MNISVLIISICILVSITVWVCLHWYTNENCEHDQSRLGSYYITGVNTKYASFLSYGDSITFTHDTCDAYPRHYKDIIWHFSDGSRILSDTSTTITVPEQFNTSSSHIQVWVTGQVYTELQWVPKPFTSKKTTLHSGIQGFQCRKKLCVSCPKNHNVHVGDQLSCMSKHHKYPFNIEWYLLGTSGQKKILSKCSTCTVPKICWLSSKWNKIQARCMVSTQGITFECCISDPVFIDKGMPVIPTLVFDNVRNRCIPNCTAHIVWKNTRFKYHTIQWRAKTKQGQESIVGSARNLKIPSVYFDNELAVTAHVTLRSKYASASYTIKVL